MPTTATAKRGSEKKNASAKTGKAQQQPKLKTKPKPRPKPKSKNMHNIELGRRGEECAVSFLVRRGFTILERNWTCFAGEADIIAQNSEAIHFIEVKTRKGEGKGFPAEAVTPRKRRRYESIAELYLNHYNGEETGITFDIISINVLENGRAIVRIYNNVLSCDCG